MNYCLVSMTTRPDKGEGRKGCFGSDSRVQSIVAAGAQAAHRVASAMRKDEGSALLAFSFLGNLRPQPKE